MRKTLFTLILAVVSGACAWVHGQTIVLSEGFENGMPAGWTQEQVIGSTSWTTETSAVGTLLYPNSTAAGFGRAVLRNETGETQGFKTRLITPVMNLDTVFQPILRYSHAQVKWTADFDTLRVLYRNTKDGEWQLLQEFTQPIQTWRKEELDLPQVSTTYQLCFEGTDNLGRGIVLDSVLVRSKPECTIPHDMLVTNMVEGGATLLWQASYDATAFQVVLLKSSEVLDMDTMSDATKAKWVVVDSIINGLNFQCSFTALSPSTNYVAYVRSLCEVESSDWGVYPFFMKAVKKVPYYENFDMAQDAAMVHRIAGWSYGSNTGNNNPFVNTNQSEADAQAYVMSGTALCFTGDEGVGADYDIPAGQYVYAATPELNVESVQDLQVRFWGSLGIHGSINTHARSIIIGVMEDPEDITTFVAIDTMTLWKCATYEEHITSLATYTGEGKSIAFVSDFDKSNQFFIDNMTIESAPAVAKVSGVNAIPAITEATISWEPVANATAYSVVVDTAYTTQVNTLSATAVLNEQVAGTTYNAKGLAEGTQYYVYVKAEGSNEWSNAVEFTTSCKRSLPMIFGFEAEEGQYQERNELAATTNTYPTCVQIYSTDVQLPSCGQSSYKYQGTWGVYYSMPQGRDAWMVFPYVDTLIQGVEIEFYMKACNADYKNTAIEIGVMEDPDDLTTFVAVATAKNATTTWRRFCANFADYTGDGKYIALRWVINEAGGATSKTNSFPSIDDVVIHELGRCIVPNCKVDEVTAETATLSWTAHDMTQFQVIVDSLDTRSETALNTIAQQSENEWAAGVYYKMDVNDAMKVTLPTGKLRPGRTYYAYVRSVCDSTEYSYWCAPISFTLLFPDVLPIPYTETFEGFGTASGTMVPGWTKVNPTETYPSLYNIPHTGAASLYTSKASTEIYAPAFNIDNMSNLLISLWGRAFKAADASTIDVLYVGVGNNPDDPNDVITWLDTISIPTTTYTKYYAQLDGWQPSMGNRVVFGTKNALANTLYLDDITFENAINSVPYNLDVLEAKDDEATFTWGGKATKGWRVLVTTEPVDPNDLETLEPAIIIYNAVNTTKYVVLTDLKAQTNYYAYVKPVEGNATWSEELLIKTLCKQLVPSRQYKMDFEGWLPVGNAVTGYSSSTFPDCWTRHGGHNTYTPFIYQYKQGTTLTATSFAHSGLAAAKLGIAKNYGCAWFATPELAAKDMANVTVGFWAKAGGKNQVLQLGVMLDPDDFSTFTKLLEVKAEGTAWTQYSFLLGEYGYEPEMGKYIAFAMNQTITGTAKPLFYIDDITINEATCPPAIPLLSRLTHNTVRIAYASEPMDVRVVLAKNNVLNEDNLNANDVDYIDGLKTEGVIIMDSLVSDQMSILVTGLESITNYSAALLHRCEDETAGWKTIEWTTMCTPTPVDSVVVVDFEAGYNEATTASPGATMYPIPCWITGSKAAAANQTNIPYVLKGAVAPAGEKSLKFHTTSALNGAYAIMPAMDVDNITQYELSFLGRAVAGTSVSAPSFATLSASYQGAIIVGVVTDPADLSTFEPVDTIVLPDNAVHKCKVRFDSYEGDANEDFGKHIAFLSEFDNTNIFYIDNLAFAKIDPCGEPLDVNVNSIGQSDALVAWNGTTESYRVVLSEEAVAETLWEDYKNYLVDDTISAESYKLQGLKSNTKYFVYVKALCDGGAGKWNLQGVDFRTDCADQLPLPYGEDFDSYPSAASLNPPACWTLFYNGTMNKEAKYPSVYTNARYNTADTDDKGLYWYMATADSTALRRPTIASLPVDDISKVTISFQLKTTASTNPSKIALGYATDISSIDNLIATVQYVDTIYPSTKWVDYSRDMKDAQGKNVHIVLSELYGKGGPTLYMDNFKVEVTPTCYVPSAQLLETTYDAVKLQITPFFEDDSAWDVMLVSEDKDTVLTSVDTTAVVVSGLQHSTNYDLYVRTNCGAGDLSLWSEPINLYTTYKIGEGTFYSFELKDGAIRTPYSTSDTYVAHPSLYVGDNNATTKANYRPYQVVQTSTAKTARTGDAALQLYTTFPNFYQSWVALPTIMGEEALQVRLDLRAAIVDGGDTIADTDNYSSIARFQVGVINEDYDLDSYQVLAEYKPSDLMLGEKVTEANNLLFDQIVVPLPKELTGKRIVLMNPTNALSSYVFVDNLSIEKQQGWQTPVITTSTITPTTLTVDWTAPGSSKWNVYLTQGTEYFPLANIPAEAIVAKQEGLTTTTATFADLQPNTTYFVYVQIAGVEDIAATSVRRLFKTPAAAKIATDSVLTFEGVIHEDLYGRYPSATNGDTIYAMSNGWYTANMSSIERVEQPWARLNGYNAITTAQNSNVVVAWEGSRALQLYSMATNNHLGAYAVMPEIAADYDTLQVNFYARPFYELAGKMGNSSPYEGQPLVVGTMTDPNNPATFVAIDTLYYEEQVPTSSEMASLKNAGFHYYSFRLTNATGKYVTFSAPVEGQWYIDNISFSEITCLPPTALQVEDITKNSALVTWKTQDGNACMVQVSKDETFTADTALVSVNTVPAGAEKLLLTALESVTTYYVRVRELCAEDESPWTSTSFTTECFEADANYTCGFELAEGRQHQGTSTAAMYDITQCWTTGVTFAASNVATYVPRVQEATADGVYYARNTTASNLQSKAGLRMYAYAAKNTTTPASNFYDGWAAMPRLDMGAMDTDTIQLEFYALPGAYNPTAGTITYSYATEDYLPSIVVGVMTDPTDISTFTALDTCTYDLAQLVKETTVATPDNEFMYQHFVVPLRGIKGKGNYVAFKTYLTDWVKAQPTAPTAAKTTIMCLDDISLQKYNECYTPENLEASNVMLSTATLSWTGDEGASWVVNLSTDPLFKDRKQAIVYMDTVTEMTFDVQGLDTMTTYYWNVQQVCGPRFVSLPSRTASFKTAYVPLFHEEFLNSTTIPLDWACDTARANNVFNGATLKGTATENAWARTTEDKGIQGTHISTPISSGIPTSTSANLKASWLITPTIVLDTEKEAWLTFYAALTHYNASETVADQTGWDDQFMVVISEDGGNTWKRENATIWNNERSNDPNDEYFVYGKGDYVLNELPFLNDESMPYSISLAQYKGKAIKVGFYCESSVLNANNELHIGDAHVNYVEYVADEETSCMFDDIISADGNFYINGDSIEAGTYEYKKFDLASLNDKRENPNDGLVDTLYTFTAHFNAVPEKVIEKTICEGEVAGSEWGFEDRSEAGVYRIKTAKATSCDCDSITTLILTVLPVTHTEEQVTICAGTSYELGGKQYAETGVYVDTLSSVVTGCDSIVTLTLTVTPPITFEYEAHICTGSSYYFTENYPALTMAGTYIETLKTVDGCDSIVTLNLVVSDVIEIEVFDTICAGGSYEFAGEQYTEAGAYPITYESTMGCDSTVTLHLYVNEPVALQLYDTICEGDIYTYNGEEYTEPGVYEFTYTSAVGCDSVVTLNLAWNKVDTVLVDTTIYDLDLPYFYPNTSVTYPKGTEPGVYTDTVMVAGDSIDCGYLLIHTLTIIPGTGLDNVLVGSLLIKPSLIEQGESVTISGFSGNKATVYVYDMVGRCVEQQAMTGNSIELNTFTTSGVYTVRVVDANGEQHVGRVMVK